MSGLVGLLDNYNGLLSLCNSLKNVVSRDIEQAALDYFNTVKNTDFEYSTVTMLIVRTYLDAELEHARMDIVNAYNNLTNNTLDYSDISFCISYKYIFDQVKYQYLNAEISLLSKKIKNQSTFSDSFLANNFEFILAIMESLEDKLDLSIFDDNPNYISDFQIYRLVLETLSRIDPTLVEIFTTMGADIVSFDENNIEILANKYNLDQSFFTNTAFFVPNINKIFYEKTNTLFDVVAILHEFGHTLSGNIKSNALSEMISIILERNAIKIFKDIGYSDKDINDAIIFRNLHIFEIINDLSFVFEHLFRHEKGLPLIEESYFDNKLLLDKVIDRELKGLNNGTILASIYNTYPYVLAYFIADRLDESSIIIKWIEEGITPEEVFKYLGYNVNGDAEQVLS